MLNFLTHKLRTHSINEENRKAEDDRDSGTESDEDLEPRIDLSARMQCRISSISPEDTGCCVESPLPDHQDAHSSEEELEVINSNKNETSGGGAVRAASVCLPEKRKWSQIGRYSPENVENISHYSNVSPRSSCSSCQRFYEEAGHHSGSSDDEVHNFVGSMSPPVQFRTSPPLEALKPGRTSVQKMRSLSPPAKVVHYEVSPRKRSRHSRHSHVQRPYLDFEKMQQVKARSLTTWHHSEDHGGEWSVYCW